MKENALKITRDERDYDSLHKELDCSANLPKRALLNAGFGPRHVRADHYLPSPGARAQSTEPGTRTLLNKHCASVCAYESKSNKPAAPSDYLAGHAGAAAAAAAAVAPLILDK